VFQKKLIFTASKYLTFGLKFVQALYIAKYLGPAGFAIYGFAQLIALYVSFLHFGIPLSIHAMLSTSKGEEEVRVKSYISDGFNFLVIAGVVYCIVGGLAVFLMPSLFEKFQFHNYGVLSVIIGVNLIVVQFFSNVYQVYGQFIRIALNELVSVILLFAVVFLYKNNEQDLLNTILLVSAFSIVINLVFFLYKAPFKIKFTLRMDVLRSLIKLGIPMLIATVGFYLITISVRSISSYEYSLYEIGLFTFALNISNSVMMGLNAISWTFYSTILANTCEDVGDAYIYIKKVNRIFNFVLCVTIFSGILVFPLLFYFLPEYKEFYGGIVILLISQILMSVSFGYNSLLVAQKKQNKMAVISFTTLLFVILAALLVCALKLPFIFQSVVIALAMLLYSLQMSYAGAKVCNQSFLKVFFGEVLNFKIIIPICCWLMVVFLDASFIWGLVATLSFFILSYNDMVYFLNLIKEKRKAE
jgi:O-antigen/teichoic acid export membrane protein